MIYAYPSATVPLGFPPKLFVVDTMRQGESYQQKSPIHFKSKQVFKLDLINKIGGLPSTRWENVQIQGTCHGQALNPVRMHPCGRCPERWERAPPCDQTPPR